MKEKIYIPKHKKTDEISVKFSGGKDSTLTAFLMAKEFKKVHLLTFGHYLTSNLENVKVNYYKLRDIFGRDRVIHQYTDIDSLYKYLYTNDYLKDVLKYKTFLTIWVGCGVCKLAMHAQTIVYNIQNGIKFTCDGANVTGFDPSQQKWLIEEVRKLYKKYDMEYFSPIYNLPRSDLELFKRGITSKKPTLFAGSQSNCLGSNFHNIYLRSYYLPRYGREQYEKESLEYWKEKIEVCRENIERETKVSIEGNKKV